MLALRKYLIGLIILIIASSHRAWAFPIDLHSHPFMKEGMGFAFSGDFNGPLAAHSWKDKLSSMINTEALNNSGLKIVVATLYAHPFFVVSLRASIRRQLQQAETFVKSNPQWIIASDAREAWDALHNGKKIIILALEGASGILELDVDFKEFLDERKIRIVTPLHLTDDEFGGVAFLRGISVLSSPFAFIRSLFKPHYDSDGHRINSRGLSEDGRTLVRKLMARRIWIDLAHSSDVSQTEIVSLLRENSLPLLYSHTSLRKYHGAERAISENQLQTVKDTQGMIGLLPSEQMLNDTPPTSDGSNMECQGGIHSFVAQFNQIADKIGGEAVTLGSDFNGGITHLKPIKCGSSSALDSEGLWNVGQVASLWKTMRDLGAKLPATPEDSVNYFIKTWARVTNPGWSPQP